MNKYTVNILLHCNATVKIMKYVRVDVKRMSVCDGHKQRGLQEVMNEEETY